MLAITINATFDSIELTSNLIQDYINALPAIPNSLTLNIKVNCNEEFSIDLNALNISVDTFTLIPDDLNMGDIFLDGVLAFELIEENQITKSKEIQTACLFVNNETKCALIDYISSNIENKDNVIFATALYQALSDINICSDCECQDGCVIFDYLNTLLKGGKLNKNSNCADCN